MSDVVNFKLRYTGEESEHGIANFYDVAQAMVGFQRSLALTTHLLLNDKVIVQAPSLRGAEIFVHPPQKGSFLVEATVLIGATGWLLTRPTDTPLGHAVSSAYDFLLRSTLGVSVNYDESLAESLDRANLKISQGKFDDLAEKCEVAIRDMHRPVIASETAERGIVESSGWDPKKSIRLTEQTYDLISYERRSVTTTEYYGFISSFNVNSYSGRLYVSSEKRTIPFKLEKSLHSKKIARLFSRNMEMLAAEQLDAPLHLTAYENQSAMGRVKSIFVTQVN